MSCFEYFAGLPCPTAMQKTCQLQAGKIFGRLILLAGLVFVLAGRSHGNTAAAAENSSAQPRLGMNLAGPSDWMTELPFVDVFRTSRPWISQKKGAGWGQGPELALDEFGWVKQLEPGCFAESMIC
jgi:hypothetical protein